MELNLTPEWINSSQSKQVFGIGFSRLMQIADAGAVDRRSLPPDENGDIAYLFRYADIKNYIEGADDGSRR